MLDGRGELRSGAYLYAEILPGIFALHFVRTQEHVAFAEDFTLLFYPASRSNTQNRASVSHPATYSVALTCP